MLKCKRQARSELFFSWRLNYSKYGSQIMVFRLLIHCIWNVQRTGKDNMSGRLLVPSGRLVILSREELLSQLTDDSLWVSVGCICV